MIATDTFKGLPGCLSHLTAEPRWVGWKWVERKGKRTKPPFQASGGLAHNDKKTTWAAYEAIEAAAGRNGFTGVGLQLLNLPGFAALDLDKVRDRETGAILYPWAERVIHCGSYAEVTPSGTGFRVLGRVPEDREPLHTKKKHPEGGEVEIYANIKSGRYITVTGDRLIEAPDTLAEITGLIDQVLTEVARPRAISGDRPRISTNGPPGNGALESGDRSADFQGIVNRLRNEGLTFDEALERLRANPGPAIKYLEPRDRLEQELKRSWGKAGERQRADGLELPPDAIDLSQDAIALDMGAKGWDRDAKYVAIWGKWLFWDGTRWKIDDRREDMTRVREFLRGRAAKLIEWAGRKAEKMVDEAEAKRLKAWAEVQASNLRHKATVASIEALAQSNPCSATGPEAFDTNLLLLGTPGGTVDLRTGEIRPAWRGDMLTKQTALAPAPPGTAPGRWLAFLSEIFAGDQELVDFMQRAAGYALTGLTTEHKLLFLYGTGRNGKSTFLDTLRSLWGDYAQKATAEAFLNSQMDRHPTDIAALNGARLVVGSELPRGKTWNEAVIKDLTGGENIRARFMRQDTFEFTPQLTLMIAGNNQPSIRGVDEAIRARVVLVPFTVTIPPERRDKGLGEKLMAEGPAILRWAIEGALWWQRDGLNVPHSVVAASEVYFDSEDIVGQFLADQTKGVVGGFEASQSLYLAFDGWCQRQGIQPWAQHTLIKELRCRGFTDAKSNGKRGLKGLKLL